MVSVMYALQFIVSSFTAPEHNLNNVYIKREFMYHLALIQN